MQVELDIQLHAISIQSAIGYYLWQCLLGVKEKTGKLKPDQTSGLVWFLEVFGLIFSKTEKIHLVGFATFQSGINKTGLNIYVFICLYIRDLSKYT